MTGGRPSLFTGVTSWRDRGAILVATSFGIGLAPRSPGTFGSLPGLAVGWAMHVATQALVSSSALAPLFTGALLTAAVLVAYWSIARMEAALHVHDDQRIVVDEVVGQAAAVAWLAPSFAYYAAAFVLFRLLDIAKPSLIGRIDREVPGAWGTLGDDVLAGVIVAGALTAAQRLWLF